MRAAPQGRRGGGALWAAGGHAGRGNAPVAVGCGVLRRPRPCAADRAPGPRLFTPPTAGTTAICVLVRGRTLLVSNVGDSRAVLAERSGAGGNKMMARDLSLDQTPYRWAAGAAGRAGGRAGWRAPNPDLFIERAFKPVYRTPI
jgi:hypothetical protein